jgi:hypothetical protein
MTAWAATTPTLLVLSLSLAPSPSLSHRSLLFPGRVVSYDIIGQDVLNDIAKVEKKGLRKSILAFLEQDEDKDKTQQLPLPRLLEAFPQSS